MGRLRSFDLARIQLDFIGSTFWWVVSLFHRVLSKVIVHWILGKRSESRAREIAAILKRGGPEGLASGGSEAILAELAREAGNRSTIGFRYGIRN